MQVATRLCDCVDFNEIRNTFKINDLRRSVLGERGFRQE